ncbi:MAG: DNA-binding protein WhiA [Firmicutes bacterium]|jgi:DNA-binding protein WhiA|nr:DNA-binding protein WhiA [Bacillota bacterium]
MSFSSKIKNRLSRQDYDEVCCQKAELSGIIRVSGRIGFKGRNKVDVTITTENPAVARLVFTLFKKSMNIHTEIKIEKNRQLKKSHSYEIVVDDAMEVLKELEIITDQPYFMINDSVPEKLIKDTCCKRSYIRGVFLGSGSVSDPEKGYHLEFVSHSLGFAESFVELINSFELNAKVIERKGNHVVYIKEGDKIVDLLNIIGAHKALMDFENVRIVKQMRNSVNRIVNCETANLSKTINASYRQTKSIRLIMDTVGLGALPENLREIALLRLEHDEMSLAELGELLNPKVGKSGVNHRLKKIEKFAEELRQQN